VASYRRFTAVFSRHHVWLGCWAFNQHVTQVSGTERSVTAIREADLPHFNCLRRFQICYQKKLRKHFPKRNFVAVESLALELPNRLRAFYKTASVIC
jgi:hypothetical protein